MLSPRTSSYRRFKIFWLAIGIAACTFTGCGDSNRGKIIGTWEIEQADTVLRKIDSADGQPQTQAPAIDPTPPKMVLTFQKNGVLTTATKMGAVDQTKKGTWAFESFDESSNEMHLACVLKGQDSNHEVEFVDQDTIKLVPPNMAGTKMKLKFKRRK